MNSFSVIVNLSPASRSSSWTNETLSYFEHHTGQPNKKDKSNKFTNSLNHSELWKVSFFFSALQSQKYPGQFLSLWVRLCLKLSLSLTGKEQRESTTGSAATPMRSRSPFSLCRWLKTSRRPLHTVFHPSQIPGRKGDWRYCYGVHIPTPWHHHLYSSLCIQNRSTAPTMVGTDTILGIFRGEKITATSSFAYTAVSQTSQWPLESHRLDWS